jgi:hypothetical protein
MKCHFVFAGVPRPAARLFVLLCLSVLAAGPAEAAAASARPAREKIRSAGERPPAWDFRDADKSAFHERWKESITATLKGTVFAPSSPAGRYLQRAGGPTGALPPARLEHLDAARPPEREGFLLGGETPITGEFEQESSGWRPFADDPSLREEKRAGAYAGFRPGEDMEIKLGPEYHFSTVTSRPEQTGRSDDRPGSLGMGMKFKLDF